MLKQLLKSSEQFLSRFGFMLSLLFLNQINSSWIAFVHPLFFLMEWMTLYFELSVKYMRCMFPISFVFDCCHFSRFWKSKHWRWLHWNQLMNCHSKFNGICSDCIFLTFGNLTLIVDSPPWILIWMPKGHCRIFPHFINVWNLRFGRLFGILHPTKRRRKSLTMPWILDFDVQMVLLFNAWLDWFIWWTWNLWVQVNFMFIKEKYLCHFDQQGLQWNNRLGWPKIWSSFWVQKLLMDLLVKSHCMSGQIKCPKFLWGWPITRCSHGMKLRPLLFS